MAARTYRKTGHAAIDYCNGGRLSQPSEWGCCPIQDWDTATYGQALPGTLRFLQESKVEKALGLLVNDPGLAGTKLLKRIQRAYNNFQQIYPRSRWSKNGTMEYCSTSTVRWKEVIPPITKGKADAMQDVTGQCGKERCIPWEEWEKKAANVFRTAPPVNQPLLMPLKSSEFYMGNAITSEYVPGPWLSSALDVFAPPLDPRQVASAMPRITMALQSRTSSDSSSSSGGDGQTDDTSTDKTKIALVVGGVVAVGAVLYFTMRK